MAARTEYAQLMREEIEAVITKIGRKPLLLTMEIG